MNPDSEAAVIINDLDSLVHRIEALQAHPEYTNALSFIQDAKQAVGKGRMAMHDARMRERFAVMDRR